MGMFTILKTSCFQPQGIQQHLLEHSMQVVQQGNHNATHVAEYTSGTTASGATLPEHEVNSGYLVEPLALSAPGGAAGFLAVGNKKSSRL
jgi:hypothetical protein